MIGHVVMLGDAVYDEDGKVMVEANVGAGRALVVLEMSVEDARKCTFRTDMTLTEAKARKRGAKR